VQRYFLALLATLTLYGSVVGVYIFFQPHKKEPKTQESSPKKVQLHLIAQKKQIKQQKKVTEIVKPKTKKRVIKKHTPLKKHKKVFKTLPKPKKTTQKKELLAPKKIAPKPKKEIKKTQKEQIESHPVKAIQKTVGVKKKQKNIQQQKQQQLYFAKVKEIINENKTYPKKAKRRGISGVVEVDFIVSKDGKFLKIEKLSGKKIFYKSVKKALKNSFPIQTPKNLFQKDIHLHLKLVYNIV